MAFAFLKVFSRSEGVSELSAEAQREELRGEAPRRTREELSRVEA